METVRTDAPEAKGTEPEVVTPETKGYIPTLPEQTPGQAPTSQAEEGPQERMTCELAGNPGTILWQLRASPGASASSFTRIIIRYKS